MDIKVIKFGDGAYFPAEENFSYCCDSLRNYSGISFGEFGKLFKNTINNMCMHFFVPSNKAENIYCHNEPINFCPFCGVEIKIETTDT
jgi:hypothetical protein